ncbi:MAG: spermidine synthase [Planctomycetota bacterium]|jgi:spermidine synthase
MTKDHEATPPRNALRPALCLAFLSGSAALIYQVVWARMLALSFGSSSHATSAVVAGFLGGMGLGAWLYHRVAGRIRNPLRAFAVLEIVIAVSTALLTYLFGYLPQAQASLAHTVSSDLARDVLRFGVTFALLVVPACAMGATFPALCSAAIRSADAVNKGLGRVYGVNTLGAAAGALLAGLVLIESQGLRATIVVANVINLMVALGAWWVSRGMQQEPAAPSGANPAANPEANPEESDEQNLASTLSPRLVGLILFVSGFTTLAYEMVWIRLFKYIVGSSTYALTTTIVVFLLGLGFGGLLLPRLIKQRGVERGLVLVQLGAAVLAMVTATLLATLLSNDGLRASVSIFSKEVMHSPWQYRLLLQGTVAVVTMLPATLLMGLTFPLATRAFLSKVDNVGDRIGVASLLSSLGSISGSILGGVVLLPLLGSLGATKALAAVNLMLAVIVFLAAREKTLPSRNTLLGAIAIVIALSIYLPRSPRFTGEIGGLNLGHSELVFQKENDLATVQVLQTPGDSSQRAMTVDGCSIGWSAGFKERGARMWRKQVILVHLPMVLDTRLESVLNVGLGSGSTLQTLTRYPQIKKMDCVEINPAVVEAAALFPESEALGDPRVSLVVEDALHHLLTTEETYDLIISDGKQHPFYSGNAPLLCEEFYRLCHERLSDKGMIVQWNPLGTLHEDMRIMLRTLAEVFDYVSVFYFAPNSILVVGSKTPLAGRPGMPSADYAASPAYDDLAEFYSADSVDALLSCWVADAGPIAEVIGEGPLSHWNKLVTDFTPFKASREDWGRAAAQTLLLLLKAENLVPTLGQDIVQGEGPFRSSSGLVRQAMMMHFAGRPQQALIKAQRALEANPLDQTAQAIQVFLQTGVDTPIVTQE